jgi:hypothetical protein
VGTRGSAARRHRQRTCRQAEQRAIAFGCHSAYVDTFSFQGPDFYPRFGYTVFGTLDYPPEHKRFFLQKRLIDPEV